jgi:hypothetical protein
MQIGALFQFQESALESLVLADSRQLARFHHFDRNPITVVRYEVNNIFRSAHSYDEIELSLQLGSIDS